MSSGAGWSILLADDHQLLREGLRRLLLEWDDVDEVGEAEDADGVLATLRERPWNLLILDVNLAGRDGLSLLERLRADGCLVPTLVLSMYPESQFGARALRAGAAGYAMKSAHPGTLLSAIRRILHGGTYITPVVAETLAAAAEPPDSVPAHERLAREEQAVLRLLAAGRTEDEVAALLGLSATTVSERRASVLRQLGLEYDAELRRYAVEHNLAQPPGES